MVEAFRTQKDIDRVKIKLRNSKDKRLYPMFIIGLNTGLRISDIVNLKVDQFRNKNGFKEYLIINSEVKTNKKKKIIINNSVKEVINEYYSDLEGYLFKSQKGGHICKDYAYSLLKNEFQKCKFKYNVATHSMRKTYGKRINDKYGIDMAQTALGHERQRDTLRYIGIEQSMLDRANLSLEI